MKMNLSFNDIFKKNFLENFTGAIGTSTICITLLYAFVISIFVFYVYKFTTKNVIYSRKFNITMSLMSIVTAAVVLSMQSNITVSLGMVGALSIVRFRTAIKEPRDLLFLFWSISNGIIIGAQIYEIAIILAIVLGIAMFFFDIIPDKKLPYLLIIYFNDLKIESVENIFKENNIKYRLKSENLSKKESSYIYEINVNSDRKFVEEICKLSGVNEANLLAQDGESQY